MVLITFTIVSFVLAAAFAAVAWRLSREERRRSEARVSALAAAIDGLPAVASAEADAPTVDVDEGPPAMFKQDRRSAVQGRPLLKAAIGFAFAVSVIVLIAMAGERREPENVPAVSAAPTEPAADTPGSLELISMRHNRTSNTITVTGLVRNAGRSTPDGISAVVFVFDRDGNYVASGRAALEFPRLSTGDESPFRVTVPDVKEVGRYRVSFRTEAGVVRHIDRRPSLQVSAN